jgi:transcriptional regulator with XRE-family HTH domain
MKIINISERLIQVREGSGLSRAEFGEKVGITYQHVWWLEKGLRNPSQALLIAIASKYDVDESWLFEDKVTNPL